MPNTHATLSALFTDVADAIRAKTGGTASICADNFPAEIAAIPTGGEGKACFRVGTSNVVVKQPYSEAVAPMRSYTKDYIVPCDSSGNDVKLNLSQPFEIGCRFKLLNAPGSDRNIWGSSDSYYRCPSIVMHSNRVTYSVSTSGNRWEYEHMPLIPSGWTAPLDTAMFARITWDGTGFAFYFDDGTNVYTAALGNVAPYYNAAYQFELGGQNKSQYSIAATGASVLLEGTYLQQGDTVIWGKKL